MTVTKYEIDMLDVEDADAFLIRFMDERYNTHIILIDAGRYSDGQKVSDFIKNTYGSYFVDLAICTHCDDDHYGGLLWLVEDMTNNASTSVDIKELWVNDPGLHSWANDFERRRNDVRVQQQARVVYTLSNGKNFLAIIDDLHNSGNPNAGMNVREVFSDKGCFAFDDIIEVIGPSEEYYESQVLGFRHSMKTNKTTPAANDTDDDDMITIDKAGNVKSKTLDAAVPDDSHHNLSSIIFMFKPTVDKIYLFTGDAGQESFQHLKYSSDWDRLKNLYWLKLPHHGSKRNITCAMINHFRPVISFCSSKNYGTWLSKAVVNALKQVNSLVYSTNAHGSMVHNSIENREGYVTAKPL